MRQILVLTWTDLKQRLRDKSVIIFAVVVPLALMFVFDSVFGAQELELEPVSVAVAVPDGDELAAVIPEALRGLGGTSFGAPVDDSDTDDESGGADAGMEVAVQEVPADEARSLVEDGEADLALLVPDGFGEAARSGTAVTLDVLRGDETGISADIVLTVVDGVLDQLAAGAVTARAGLAEGVPPEELAALAEQAVTAAPAYELAAGEASSEQLEGGAALVAGQAGLFLFFTVSFGVTALLLERETGTLARLRSMPMPGWYVVTSKALVSLVLGVVATTVLLTAGGWLFEADFGSPLAVGVLVLCVCVAGTSVMFLITRIAKTSEQASIATSVVAMVLGIGGGAFMPVTASGALSTLLDLNPVAALIRGLGITASGGGVGDIGVPVAIMLGFTAVMLVASRLVPDRGALA